MPADDGEWFRVAGPDDVAEGGVRSAQAGTKQLALCRIGGVYGALDGTCPHMGGPLAEGMIENGRLVCPWHGREYDPATGACDGYDESVAAYPVDVRSDGVYVRVGTNKG